MQYEDRLSKYLFYSLLADYEIVEIGSNLLPDMFYADVLVIPEEPLPENLPGAGLFARLTGSKRCLVESYSIRLLAKDIHTSLAKLRLALQRAYKDKLGKKPPQGVLWLTVPYWPQKALAEVLHAPCEELEKGLRCWRGNEIVYVVNTSKIQLREETILFRLLGKGQARRECVFEIFKTHIEPYVTVLNNFDLRFKKMAISPQIQQIDPRLLADLQELRDTREEVLRELGREEGRELGREEGRELGRELGREEGLRDSIKTLAKKRFPKIKNASFQTLSELSANELQEILVEMLDISDMHSLQKLLADKKSLAPKK